MLKYGSDKPDLRNPLIIADVSAEFARDDVSFKAFKGKVVRAIPAPGAAAQPRSFFDKLNDWARSEGAPGLGYIIFDEENGALIGKGPIAKFIPPEALAALAAKGGVKAGDALFFSAGEELKAAKLAGAARLRIGTELGLSQDRCVRVLLDRRLPDVRVERGRQEDRLLAQPVLDAAGRPGGAGDARTRSIFWPINTTSSATASNCPRARSATIARTS